MYYNNFSPRITLPEVSSAISSETIDLPTDFTDKSVRIVSDKGNTVNIWIKFSNDPSGTSVIPTSSASGSFPIVPGAIEIFAISEIAKYMHVISTVAAQKFIISIGNGS